MRVDAFIANAFGLKCVLTALGAGEIDLLSSNPDKARQLRERGITVRRTMLTGAFATGSNLRYLRAEVSRTGHTIALAWLAS